MAGGFAVANEIVTHSELRFREPDGSADQTSASCSRIDVDEAQRNSRQPFWIGFLVLAIVCYILRWVDILVK